MVGDGKGRGAQGIAQVRFEELAVEAFLFGQWGGAGDAFEEGASRSSRMAVSAASAATRRVACRRRAKISCAAGRMVQVNVDISSGARLTADIESPAPDPWNCSNAGPVVESPCRYNSGRTSFICGDLCTQAGRIDDENH